MIRHFLLIAARSFLRQKFYSFINVFGLTTGLTVALTIFLWVRDEWRTDRFHQDVDQIYRAVTNLKNDDGSVITWANTPGPLGDWLKSDVAQAQNVVRVVDNNTTSLFQYDDKNFLEKGYLADPDFFKLFSFKIVAGVNNPIDDKSAVAISERLAKNLFGDEDPINKIVKFSRSRDLTVKAVFKNITGPSSMKFEFVASYEIYREQRGNGFTWTNMDHPIYFKVSNPETVALIESQINAHELKREKDSNVSYYLQPFQDMYLYGHYEEGRPVGGRIEYVKIFSMVAIFIVLIACINFMNMATAKATIRAKEVGVRKVVGGERKSLVFQFLGESISITIISTVLALMLTYLMLPLFNMIVSKQITLSFFEPGLLGTAFLIALVTGIVAGSYPAFFLSSFQPAAVLKASSVSGAGTPLLRKTLVVFQFALTAILIASAFVVYDQINFIQRKSAGYSREGIINFRGRGDVWKQFDVFKNEVLEIPGVESLSRADGNLVNIQNQNGSVKWPGRPDNSNLFFRTIVVDEDFPKTLNLKLTEGRFFSQEFNDSGNFILNTKAIELMGLKNPVGQKISQWGFEGTVVGVVEDFHIRSLQEPIDPVVMMCRADWPGNIYIRIVASEPKGVIEQIEKTYKKYSPEYPFNYSFVEDDYNNLYQNEQVTASLAVGFTSMAIIISALGLLGLAAYTTERKRKEIGIRKTMGASVGSLIQMISWEFARLSILAALVGLPIAYYLMDSFLNAYAYHTELNWKVFVLTGASIILIAVSTVIYQVSKAAFANPVEALRNE